LRSKRVALFSLTLAAILSISIVGSASAYCPFATEVTYTNGYTSINLYQDPSAVLGKPHALNPSWGPCPAGPVSMVEPSFGTDPMTKANKITTIRDGQEIVVTFDHPVVDDPANPYGIDFVVFGNPMFVYGGWANIPYTTPIKYPTSVFAEPVTVSVSPDGINWYTYEEGPYGDDLFPTQAVRMREDNSFRDDDGRFWEKDFTKPVDPSLTVDDFGGITVYEADNKYGVSAGGTGFDLEESGFTEIKYVRLTSSGGEIDAIADVDPALEETYVIPTGTASVDLDPSSLSLKWNAPKATGDVTYHLNLYGNGSHPDISTDIVGSDFVETVFKNLDGHQGYRLYIGADYTDASGEKVKKAGLWQFYTKNRTPRIIEVIPGDGKKYVPIDSRIGVKAEDPDEDAIKSVLFCVWKGRVTDDRDPDFTFTEESSATVDTTLPLSNDIAEVLPDTTYTWRIVLSDDQGGSISSPRYTFTTAPKGFSREEIKVSGDVDVFNGIDTVSTQELSLLKEALSCDINLMKETVSVDATEIDTASTGIEKLVSADAILENALSFEMPLSGDADSAILPLTVTFDEEDFTALSLDVSAISSDVLLEHVHIVKSIGSKAFDLVKLAGDDVNNIFNVTPIPNSNSYSVEFSMLIMDSETSKVEIVDMDDHGYIAVWDGKKDGKLSDPITAYSPKSSETPSDPSGGSGDSSGGCSVSNAPMALMLLLPLLGLMKR